MFILANLGEKIKSSFEWVRGVVFSKDFYLIVLMITLTLLGYGLGRLSNITSNREPVKIEMLGEVIGQNSSQDTLKVATVNSATKNIKQTLEATNNNVPVTSSLAGVYVGSRTSTKYHLPTCSGAKRIKEENRVWFKSKEEAESRGYTPAGNCPGI